MKNEDDDSIVTVAYAYAGAAVLLGVALVTRAASGSLASGVLAATGASAVFLVSGVASVGCSFAAGLLAAVECTVARYRR